jgi:DNA polymerase
VTSSTHPDVDNESRAARRIARANRDAPFDGAFVPQNAAELKLALNACRRCELWRHAIQGVPGEGAARAKLMLVGEQPGDQEDVAGHPFVGPAGRLLDKALDEAGVPRKACYVTNAVKHFKFERRGKRRIHAKPDVSEIKACKWWLDNERRMVKPKVIVALGATAGRSVLGRAVTVREDRAKPHKLEGGTTAILTVHPSYMLRIPDREDKAEAFALFVEDLKTAWALVG